MTPWVTRLTDGTRTNQWGLQFGHGGDAVGDTDIWEFYLPREKLQFGHGGDAVGDADLRDAGLAYRDASIRPRR